MNFFKKRRCPICGTPAKSNFCPECGRRLIAEPEDDVIILEEPGELQLDDLSDAFEDDKEYEEEEKGQQELDKIFGA